MSAFNGSLVTPTREIDTSRDGTTSNAGSLILTAMCSPAALPGTTGACCDKISGDWCKKITGSATLNVGKYAVTNVGGSGGKPDTTAGSWTIYTAGDQKIKVGKNRSLQVNGSETNVTLGPTYEMRHGAHHQNNTATCSNVKQHDYEVVYGLSATATTKSVYASGIYVNAYFTHGDFYGARLSLGYIGKEARRWNDEVYVLKNEVDGIKTCTRETESNIGGLETRIKELENQVGNLNTKFHTLRLGRWAIGLGHVPASV